jgi:hypothetical protein
MSTHGVILFSSTQAAIRAEKVLKQAGLTIKLVPTPRQFSSDCGVALRFAWSDLAQIQTRLAVAQVEFDVIHPLE